DGGGGAGRPARSDLRRLHRGRGRQCGPRRHDRRRRGRRMSPAAVGGAAGGPRRDWIVQATDVLDAGPAAPHPNGAPLDVIDQTLEMASLITGSLPGEFFDWIADALDSFSELLNDFTGDS